MRAHIRKLVRAYFYQLARRVRHDAFESLRYYQPGEAGYQAGIFGMELGNVWREIGNAWK